MCHIARRPGPAGSRGLAAVELCFVLPIFLLLLMACGEIGRAAYQYNTLTKAVRDGAQYAAQNALIPATGVMNLTGAVQAAAKNLVVYGNPGGTGSPLLPSFAVGNVSVTATDATHVKVSATYAYVPLFAAIPTFGYSGNNITPPASFTAADISRAL